MQVFASSCTDLRRIELRFIRCKKVLQEKNCTHTNAYHTLQFLVQVDTCIRSLVQEPVGYKFLATFLGRVFGLLMYAWLRVLQYEMTGSWTLGQRICDLWITSDVFCCTASILNIVVIALDRYWLITRNVRYTHSTLLPRRTVCIALLTGAWLASALIASAPLLGWRAGTERQDPNACLISQDYAYTIFSTFGAFWFPLSVILIVYAKIFMFARRRATRRAAAKSSATVGASTAAALAASTINPNTSRHRLSTSATRDNVDSGGNGGGIAMTKTSCNLLQLPQVTYGVESRNITFQATGPRSSDASIYDATNADISDIGETRYQERAPAAGANNRKCRRAKRMRRSARTLGLIIGGFVVCWLPFFVVATTMPFCPSCHVPPTVSSVVLWLGYSNSLLNPAIYAIWDRSFRRAFRRLLACDFCSWVRLCVIDVRMSTDYWVDWSQQTDLIGVSQLTQIGIDCSGWKQTHWYRPPTTEDCLRTFVCVSVSYNHQQQQHRKRTSGVVTLVYWNSNERIR